MGFLQDIGSWIFMPRSLTIFTSIEGDRFQIFAATPNEEPDRDSKARAHDWTVSVRTPVQARHVMVVVRGFGTIPDWHPGAGEMAWFFTDEIIVR